MRRIYALPMAGTDHSPALAGITVIDLGRVLAAPFTTSVLASLGARVIKVERPGLGDDSRAFGPHRAGKSLYFTSVNCDKESIALDLTQAGDRAIFESLLDSADVLVENFAPHVMENFGYGWNALHTRWPRLIYGALSGFGKTGPLGEKPAYDIIAQALSGMMSITGESNGPPVRVGASIGDLVAGLYLALGIVSAIHKRTRTNEGCLIDVAMLDCQIAFLEAAVTTFTATHVVPKARGTRHPSIAPFQAFHCADRWIVIAAGNDLIFGMLGGALDCQALTRDPRFDTNANRVENVDALDTQLSAMLCTKPAASWLDLLTKAGVPCALIQSVDEMIAMPQVIARGMIVPVDDPALPGVMVSGNPIKMSTVPARSTRGAAPDLDQHRLAILAELAHGKLGTKS